MILGRNLPFDFKLLTKLLLAMLGLMVAMQVTRGPGFVVIVPFVLMAMGNRDKPERLFFFLLLIIAAVVGNAKVFPKDLIFSLTQRALMLGLALVMTVQIAGMRSCPSIRPISWFMVYIFYMIIPSIDGWNPIISLLKMTLFASVFFAFYGAATRVATLPKTSAEKIRSTVLSFVVFFMVGSLILVPFPSVSQMVPSEFEGGLGASTATSLFKGMTMHSQCMGPCTAMCGVFVLADWVFSIRKFDRLYMALSLIIPYIMYLTSSRTAMGAYLAGCCFIMFFFMQARGIRSRWRSKVVSVALMVIAALSIIVIAVPSFQKGATKFILKGRDAEVNFETVTSSREGLNARSMYNFHKKPSIGNGFQVGEHMVDHGESKSLKDYLSAPIEKGFWGSAVLEEGGVCGFSLFVLSLVIIFTGLLKNKAYVGASCFFILFVTNFGEFMMFSMSYTGGFLWAMVFGGLAIDAVRNRDEKAQRDFGRFLSSWR